MAATRRLRVRTAGAALVAGALLTAGCAGNAELDPATTTEGSSAPGSSAPAETSGPSAPPSVTPSPAPATTDPPPGAPTSEDLRERLLPASAFGTDATVVPMTPDQIGAAGTGWGGWGGGWGGWWDDGERRDGGRGDRAGEVTVEPEGCRTALAAFGSLEDSEDADEPPLAAQAARTPQTQTVQVLAESPEVAALELPVDRLLAECGTVTATGPWGWSATVELTPLPVPPLGQRSAGVQVTVDGAGPEPRSVLVGLVLDGSRGLLLAQSAAPDAAAPDPAAFATLLAEAAATAAG